MDISKLNNAMDELKEYSNGGAFTSDIYATHDGQSIVAFNSNPVASAMFNQITQYIATTMKESGMPALGKYYIIELQGNIYVVVINLGEYQWGMAVDTKICSLGMMINVVIPHITALFRSAVPG
ncbi:MAG: hypothetical protein JW902_18405 [Syntrophaceae bacterium]|nr:hypothetical protein [Syntrophaceae bacterium]